ncbi:PhoH family protein [Oceanibaculum pacificum]|uniref:PhoH-like protein n=1 Tax=Oceanibaculum pacificum TaxID=580166 RepID=A0A154VSG5_9PROT|nr:PhoH family protein [Oceanibaculum pacificum]KZD04205.1 phosphate starvation-inducible protein PhoH [Oceanibaculum pacificum]
MSRTDLLQPPIHLKFDDPSLLPILFGDHDRNLVRLEQKLDVAITYRGDLISIDGSVENANAAKAAIEGLADRLGKSGAQKSPRKGSRKGQAVGQPAEIALADIDAAANFALNAPGQAEPPGDVQTLATWKRAITPRSPTQALYLDALMRNELVFGMGPAGTGKTYLAVAMAVWMLKQRRVDRLILSRPAVEAGERLGFLPGDMKEKIDPYLRPLYDALYDMMPGDQVEKRIASGEIEVAPLAFMRGRTLANAFVILDEAQNTTPTQMKMFLTRLGENSRMAVTGDLSQTDLPLGAKSGLRDAVETLQGVRGIEFVPFNHKDVVRHPLVTRIVLAYDHRDRPLLTEEGEKP